jgi:isopenicillin N synthase-like dioxygenase
MGEIPHLDLNRFLSGDARIKQTFVEAIGKGFNEIGFVALKGHFLSAEHISQLYASVQSFFQLPLDEKMNYHIEGGGGQRGYTPFGKESAEGKNIGDLKEFWHFGQEVASDSEYHADYAPNVTVPVIPHFNRLGMETFRLLEKTALEVLRAIALYLELEENYFDPYVKEGNSILRAIHYPPITAAPKGAVRAAAHGDINLITLLMGAQGSGLEVKNRKGEWVAAVAEADELMINIGDMLSRFTNNHLKSTIHRVVNPPKAQWGSSRYSIPFFMHPVKNMDLSCLPSCVDASHPKQFEDITAGAFLEQRLQALGLIKK